MNRSFQSYKHQIGIDETSADKGTTVSFRHSTAPGPMSRPRRFNTSKLRDAVRLGVAVFLISIRMTRRGIYHPIASDDGIVRSRILPGFQFRTDDLLRRPALKTLRFDPLYREFLLPDWQRAEQERDEMIQARLKAIANLHAMGLSHKQIARALGLGIETVTNVLESR